MLAAVLLDLDGTLLDTADDFVHAFNIFLSQEGATPVSRAVLVPHISTGLRGMVCAVWSITPNAPEYPNLFESVRALYQEQSGKNARLFPGLAETLRLIRAHKLKWGIVTNKYTRYSEPLIRKMNLQPDVLVCPEDVEHSKPAPDALLHACAKLGCTPDETLYVGDHQRDIECGKSAGSLTAVANWGYVDPADSIKWGADYILEHSAHLDALITQLSTDAPKGR